MMGRRSGRLQPRATVVVVNDNKILLVKRRNDNLWALPGGRIAPTEDPATRAVITLAESTGLRIFAPQFVGEYAGRVSANQVFVSEAEGALQPNPRYLEDARWWDLEEGLPLQDHVTAILAMIQPPVEEVDEAETPSGASPLPDHVTAIVDVVQAPVEEVDEAETLGGDLSGHDDELHLDKEDTGSFSQRFRTFVATAGVALWTGLQALILALRVAGTGIVYGTDGVIALALTFQGTRPSPLPRRSFPKGAREALARLQSHRCVYCGVNLRTRATHIDHIMPLAGVGH